MKSYDVCLFPFDISFHYSLKIQKDICHKWQGLFFNYGSVLLHCRLTPHISFVHSLINRHLGYFYTLAIINNATINTSMQISASSQCFVPFFFFFLKRPK